MQYLSESNGTVHCFTTIFFAAGCLFANFGAPCKDPTLFSTEILLVDHQNPGFSTPGFKLLRKC